MSAQAPAPSPPSGSLSPERPSRGRLALERGRKLDELRREFGLPSACLAAARSLAGWLPDRIEEQLLLIEGERGVLGPAHRRWSHHSANANRAIWTDWDWSAGGEEWSASEEWKDALIEEVMAPAAAEAETILEIGPGGGRWTEALHERARELILVDITQRTLDLCRERLGDPPDTSYVLGDGAGLGPIADSSVDLIWSFDAFVHVAPLDVAAYLDDFARVLRPGGVAIIHHTGRRSRLGWRSPLSAKIFARLARERGLTVLRQFDSWGGGRFDIREHDDVITEIRRPAATATNGAPSGKLARPLALARRAVPRGRGSRGSSRAR